jgi:hypothetical protein
MALHQILYGLILRFLTSPANLPQTSAYFLITPKESSLNYLKFFILLIMTWLELAKKEKDWLNKGKAIFIDGFKFHGIDLESNITKDKIFVKEILNSIDKIVALLENIDKNSSEDFSSLIFKNIRPDIDQLKIDTQTFLSLGGFQNLK